MLSAPNILSLLRVALALSPVLAEQTPLASRAARGAGTDYEQLFANTAESKPGVLPWSRERWNGLTSFAGAPPLRCWGDDEDVAYDVAVVGAPFDTATSYRPGCVLTSRDEILT